MTMSIFKLGVLLAMVFMPGSANADFLGVNPEAELREDVSELDSTHHQRNLKVKLGAILNNNKAAHTRESPYTRDSPRADADWHADVANYHSCKSTKAPKMKSSRAPTLKSTKTPTARSTKSPSVSTKAPHIKSTRAPFLCPDDDFS